MNPWVVFDMDGVLADTERVVRWSYAQVGVTMPDTAWGEPWENWLYDLVGADEAERLHDRKTEVYARALQVPGSIEPLAGATTAKRLLGGAYHVRFLTSASSRAAESVLRQVGLPIGLLAGTGCGTPMKGAVLRSLSDTGLYIDDLAVGATIAETADWDFLAFTNDARRMMEDIDVWTQ